MQILQLKLPASPHPKHVLSWAHGGLGKYQGQQVAQHAIPPALLGAQVTQQQVGKLVYSSKHAVNDSCNALI